MPTELLPRRPYVELSPPSDGFVAAVTEARRRRRRTVVTAAAGTSATAAVIAVAVAMFGGGAGGDAILRPAPVPPAGLVTSPGPHTSAAGVTPVRAHDSGRRSSGLTGSSSTATSSFGAPAAVADAGDRRRPITLTRTRSTSTAGPDFCRTGDEISDTYHPGSDWCPTATAVAVGGGERLSLTLCRDSTSSGTLTFDSSREVDFVVKRGSQRIWSWRHYQPGTSSPHTLSAPANGCWTWSLVWPGVTQSGGSAGRGSYTLVAASTADEIRYSPSVSTPFDY